MTSYTHFKEGDIWYVHMLKNIENMDKNIIIDEQSKENFKNHILGQRHASRLTIEECEAFFNNNNEKYWTDTDILERLKWYPAKVIAKGENQFDVEMLSCSDIKKSKTYQELDKNTKQNTKQKAESFIERHKNCTQDRDRELDKLKISINYKPNIKQIEEQIKKVIKRHVKYVKWTDIENYIKDKMKETKEDYDLFKASPREKDVKSPGEEGKNGKKDDLSKYIHSLKEGILM
jgi:hypothetical protein